MTLAELAGRLECRLDGDGAIEIVRVASLVDAGPGDVTFLANPEYTKYLSTTRASAVILSDDEPAAALCAVLRSKNPYLTFARAVGVLSPQPPPVTGISAQSVIDPTAIIGPDVAIGPFVVIGARVRLGARTLICSHVSIGDDTTIGDDCLIRAHVSIRERVEIGHRVIVQDGATIGTDGFGFATRADGRHEKIPQVGRVVIEDDVEIGAQTAIDRPAVGETRVAAGTKTDNFVQIAHGVSIGRHALIAAQVGIAGSTSIGDGVRMGGHSGAIGHLHVGANVAVSAKSLITKDVDANTHVSGVPAVPTDEWRETTVLTRKLPELRRLVASLEARLAAIESQLATRNQSRS